MWIVWVALLAAPAAAHEGHGIAEPPAPMPSEHAPRFEPPAASRFEPPAPLFEPPAPLFEPPAPLFEPPAPGSYELPPIDTVGSHVLLDEGGEPRAIPALGPDEVAVVSFIYASCGQSCPLALATLQALDRDLAARPTLRSRTRLLTVSFDPARDRPERMRLLRESLAPKSDWRFLTAPDGRALAPVLEDYGQRVTQRLDLDGAETGLLEHVLKVFLVDGRNRVRNVYSVGLMDPRLVLNDIETVLSD